MPVPLLLQILAQTESAGQDRRASGLQAGRCLAEGAKGVPAGICRQAADGWLTLLRQSETRDANILTTDEESPSYRLAG